MNAIRYCSIQRRVGGSKVRSLCKWGKRSKKRGGDSPRGGGVGGGGE